MITSQLCKTVPLESFLTVSAATACLAMAQVQRMKLLQLADGELEQKLLALQDAQAEQLASAVHLQPDQAVSLRRCR